MYARKRGYFATAKWGKNDSKFEADKAQELELLLKAKSIVSYKEQTKLPLVVNGYLVCHYTIDFIVYHYDGTIEFIETKGYATDVWKLKWKLFKALYSSPINKFTVEYQGKSWSPRMSKVKNKTSVKKSTRV